ncbi:MAG: ABC transporter ATP-binding protein [Nitrospinae bacterium]|nr:ABC transporter ATP-binding protein [Nitrospinota bacterium]
MVMVRLNHVTTRYDPLQYQVRTGFSIIAHVRPPGAWVLPVAGGPGTGGLQGRAKRPGEKVLDDLSLTILPGETLSVVGPSGCGKSTLLRVIAGLLEPEVGDVYFDGEQMNGQPPRARHIGMVFQNYALYPHMPSQENLGFFWRLRRTPEQEITEKVRQTAHILGVGFDALLGRFPRQLSGGEQQRVALGRCIIRDPSAFLLDEPFANLDAHLRAQSRREVKKLLTTFAVTTVFVTHDQQEAAAMGDRLAVMREGGIVQVGTFKEVYEDPRDSFVAGFLGDPPISLLRCRYQAATRRLEGDGGVTVGIAGGHSMLEDGQEVLLGVRAEHVLLTSHPQEGAMQARVSHIEPRFADRTKILYLELGAQACVAKVPYDTTVTMGATVVIRFDPAKVLLFDAHTQRRLRSPYHTNA